VKNANNIDFLNELSQPRKKRYQGFLAELGIEHGQVFIPVEKSKEFALLAESQRPESKKQLVEIIRRFDGFIEEV